jgi:hypothetical protein
MTREHPAPYLKGDARTDTAQRARALYEEGRTIGQVANLLGRSPSSTRMLLAEAGTTFRARSRRAPQDTA